MDIMLLQEVDHFGDFYQPLLDSMGFTGVYLQRPTRKDGLCIAFRRDKYELVDSCNVYFDELATGSGNSIYERNNVGLLCRLLCKSSGISFVAATAHLYWNPARTEVKMQQARFLLQRIEKFVSADTITPPLIIGGDFNSVPASQLYQQLTSPEGISFANAVVGTGPSEVLHGPDTKFLLDASLVRLCKWMRVLGIDAALESEESQQARAQGKKMKKSVDYNKLFQQARDERRIILTNSRGMIERANCPQYSLVRTNMGMEAALISIVNEFGLLITEEKFLTVCGKCGGTIESVFASDPRLVGKFAPDDRPVFICKQCSQLYWWNLNENSSPARAMRVAERLHSLIKLNEAAVGDSSASISSNVQVQEEVGGAGGGGDGVGEEDSFTQTSESSTSVKIKVFERELVGVGAAVPVEGEVGGGEGEEENGATGGRGHAAATDSSQEKTKKKKTSFEQPLVLHELGLGAKQQ